MLPSNAGGDTVTTGKAHLKKNSKVANTNGKEFKCCTYTTFLPLKLNEQLQNKCKYSVLHFTVATPSNLAL